MKEVKVIENIKQVIPMYKIAETTEPEILVDEKDIVKGKTVKEEVVKENNKYYFVIHLQEHVKETGEESNMYKKEQIKVGDYLYKDINPMTKEVRYTIVPSDCVTEIKDVCQNIAQIMKKGM